MRDQIRRLLRALVDALRPPVVVHIPHDDPYDYVDGCCALDEGHDGPCAWVCSECNGSQHCWACGGPSGDDIGTGCGECDGTGSCFHCYEGMVSDDV